MDFYEEILDQFQAWRQSDDENADRYFEEFDRAFSKSTDTDLDRWKTWQIMRAFIGGLKPTEEEGKLQVEAYYYGWLKWSEEGLMPSREELQQWYDEKVCDECAPLFASFAGGVLARSTVRITIK